MRLISRLGWLALIASSVASAGIDTQEWTYKQCRALLQSGGGFVAPDPAGPFEGYRSTERIFVNSSDYGSSVGRSVTFATEELHMLFTLHAGKYAKLDQGKYGLWREDATEIEGSWGVDNETKKRKLVNLRYEEWGDGVPDAVRRGNEAIRLVLTAIQKKKTEKGDDYYGVDQWDNQGNLAHFGIWKKDGKTHYRVFRICGNGMGQQLFGGPRREIEKDPIDLE